MFQGLLEKRPIHYIYLYDHALIFWKGGFYFSPHKIQSTDYYSVWSVKLHLMTWNENICVNRSQEFDCQMHCYFILEVKKIIEVNNDYWCIYQGI